MPSVCTSAVSTNSPMAKPMTAPGTEPASSPTEATISGVRSALTPSSEICEMAVICTITATRPMMARRTISETLIVGGAFTAWCSPPWPRRRARAGA